jgi:hypothetical protein
VRNPKFSIGQHVAVFAMSAAKGVFAIPSTVVQEVKAQNCSICHDSFMYKVSGDGVYFCESMLRPIDPKTEYQDESITETER